MKVNLLEKYNKPLQCASIISYIVIAYTYYRLWAYPSLDEAETIFKYVGLILFFEFVLAHSGMMVLGLGRTFRTDASSRYSVLLFITVYIPAIWVSHNYFPDSTLLYTYTIVTFNRMKVILFEPSAQRKNQIAMYSVITVFLYGGLLLFFLIILWEYIPVLGLTDQFLSQSGYKHKYSGGISPHVPLAFGMAYFSFLVIIELFFTWYPERLIRMGENWYENN